MQAIADVIERACGYGGDQVCLAVAMPQSTTPHLDVVSEEWEEIAMEHGFEYVDFELKEKNEFGEKVGVQRVREVLETCEWESSEGLDIDLDGDDDEGEGFGGFAAEEAEMNMELFGMKTALQGFEDKDAEDAQSKEDEAKEVEELEIMMKKAMAIKGMSMSTA
jgi:hypothetical protein